MMKEIYEDIKQINALDPASASDRLCKLFEESGELAQAVNKMNGRKSTSETEDEIRDEIIGEAADTIQCVLSLIDEWDIEFSELKFKMMVKNGKWRDVINKRLENEKG